MHVANIDAEVPQFLCAIDLATHQGVVCVAVRTVIRACVENVLEGGAPD